MEHKEQLLLIDTSHPHYPDVLQLRDDLLRKPLGLNLYLEDLSEEQHEMIFVYTINDQVQACVLLKPLSQQVVKVRQMAVRQECQGLGYGSKLLKYAETQTLQKGYNKFELHARCNAQPFYEKLQYKTIGPIFMEVGIPHIKMFKQY